MSSRKGSAASVRRSLLTETESRAAMSAAVLLQCVGMLLMLMFMNGVLLLYFSALGFTADRVVFYLSLPRLLQAFAVIPSAYYCASHGKKRIGHLGRLLMGAGGACFVLGGLVSDWQREAFIALGVGLCGVGEAMFASGWFALLDGIVPPAMRGRFFGRLRFWWQSVGVVVTAVCSMALSERSPMSAFYGVLAVGILGVLMSGALYSLRIPEVEGEAATEGGPMPTLLRVMRAPGYLPFCAYVFLISAFTAALPAIFGLLERNALGMEDRTVVWLGNAGMLGCVLGFFLGGRAVDRWGTKLVFLAAHFGYALSVGLFLLRDIMTVPLPAYLGALHFAFGVVYAGSTIAISTEMLALFPAENKPLASSVCYTFLQAGAALCGLLGAGLLRSGMLRETWRLGKLLLSAYDGILLIAATMVVLLTVTLGLVPSVIGKSADLP